MSAAAPVQLCAFLVDGLLLGLYVREVEEVLRHQAVTRVPLAPPVVEGLLNLRGRIVTVLDLRRRLGLAERPADAEPTNVVVFTPDGAVSLLADAIVDVIEVDQDAFELAPETIRPGIRELLKGVYKLEQRLLLVLDVERAVAFET